MPSTTPPRYPHAWPAKPERLAELLHEYHAARGSVSYWTQATRAAERDAQKHEGQRQENDLARMTRCKAKQDEARTRFDNIKEQLTALDPHGSKTRQNNALASAIARAKRELKYCQNREREATSDDQRHYWHDLAEKRRAKLAELQAAQANIKHANESAGERELEQTNNLAIASAPYAGDELSDELQQCADAHDIASAQETSILSLRDRHLVAAGLHRARIHAEARGDLAEADRLAAALKHQLELIATDNGAASLAH